MKVLGKIFGKTKLDRHSKGRRGRPQQPWKNQVTDFMRSRNMEENMKKTEIFGIQERIDDC
jgi:hypothetical protein